MYTPNAAERTKSMKKFISLLCTVSLLFSMTTVFAEAPEVSAKSMILMEASTGQILAENNADERLPIASVTKIMTLLILMESLDSGKIKLDDSVSVSENAMSMGGSTMFLESGEELSLDEIIKGIAVASANDGCVAAAEFLSGDEASFIALMNERAKELGMENTQFKNTNGLDEEGHFSSARDVAIMSRELIRHEKIFDYTTIWTGKMHNDKFDLSNTNKLIRFYHGANGLKTGSTSQAGCCLSATAKRNGMQLIAVVLGAPNSKERFAGARKLLDYGFANYAVYTPQKTDSVSVKKGKKDTVSVKLADGAGILIGKGNEAKVEEVREVPEEIVAPIAENDKIGIVKFCIDGENVAERDILAAESVAKKGICEMFLDILKGFIRV